jgi:hypothetical protein
VIGRRPLVACLGSLLVLAGCTSEPTAIEGGVGPLTGICPETVVIQSDWYPDAVHGALYQLLDPDRYVVDTDDEIVTARLVAGGHDMGVNLQIRSGGPAIDFDDVPARLHLDPDILLGVVVTDEAIRASGRYPTVGVVNLLERDPLMIMWDPATYDVDRLADLPPGTVVSVFGPAPYLDHLVAEGVLDAAQVAPDHSGTPDRWVAADGAIAQQGFATTDPYLYEHEVSDWGRPVRFQLLHDLGWEVYAATLAVTPASLDTHAACLEALVPLVQQAIVDYISGPEPTNRLIARLVDRYGAGSGDSLDLAAWSVAQQVELGIVDDGPDGRVGGFDLDRVQRVIERTVSFVGTGEGLTPGDLVTNRFIDDDISLESAT